MVAREIVFLVYVECVLFLVCLVRSFLYAICITSRSLFFFGVFSIIFLVAFLSLLFLYCGSTKMKKKYTSKLSQKPLCKFLRGNLMFLNLFCFRSYDIRLPVRSEQRYIYLFI